MKRFLFVLVACVGFAASSAAQEITTEAFETGKTLLRQCRGESVGQARCLSYIEGVADAMRLEQAYRRTFFGSRVCINQNVLGYELKDIVVYWLKEHPEWERSPATELIAKAVYEAYPCLQ